MALINGGYAKRRGYEHFDNADQCFRALRKLQPGSRSPWAMHVYAEWDRLMLAEERARPYISNSELDLY